MQIFDKFARSTLELLVFVRNFRKSTWHTRD